VEKILSNNFFNPEARKISFFEKNGGYEMLEKNFQMKPAEVTEIWSKRPVFVEVVVQDFPPE
jgi:hypothetical protein